LRAGVFRSVAALASWCWRRVVAPLTPFLFIMTGRPPRPTLFPYTTLFRSLTTHNKYAREINESRLAQINDTSRVFHALIRDEFPDRKSTRLNSSHVKISYAVFCLKKKKISYASTGLATEANDRRNQLRQVR